MSERFSVGPVPASAEEARRWLAESANSKIDKKEILRIIQEGERRRGEMRAIGWDVRG